MFENVFYFKYIQFFMKIISVCKPILLITMGGGRGLVVRVWVKCFLLMGIYVILVLIYLMSLK